MECVFLVLVLLPVRLLRAAKESNSALYWKSVLLICNSNLLSCVFRSWKSYGLAPRLPLWSFEGRRRSLSRGTLIIPTQETSVKCLSEGWSSGISPRIRGAHLALTLEVFTPECLLDRCSSSHISQIRGTADKTDGSNINLALSSPNVNC